MSFRYSPTEGSGGADPRGTGRLLLLSKRAMSPRIVDVKIDAHEPALVRLGASQADFAAALDTALESLANKPPAELPRPSDINICLGGNNHRLGDVAAIRVRLG
jgi:hypothetical protein